MIDLAQRKSGTTAFRPNNSPRSANGKVAQGNGATRQGPHAGPASGRLRAMIVHDVVDQIFLLAFLEIEAQTGSAVLVPFDD